jgi:hypothetical protein
MEDAEWRIGHHVRSFTVDGRHKDAHADDSDDIECGPFRKLGVEVANPHMHAMPGALKPKLVGNVCEVHGAAPLFTHGDPITISFIKFRIEPTSSQVTTGELEFNHDAKNVNPVLASAGELITSGFTTVFLEPGDIESNN